MSAANIDVDVIRKLEKLKNNLPLFARTCLKVVTISGDLEPFIFNESQNRLHAFIEKQKAELGMVRVVVLKGRKQGVSTYTAARFLHQAIFSSTKQVFILSHHSSTTNVLFNIVATFYRNLPEQLKLKLLKDNDKYLMFENGSQYTVATAGAGEIGRGDTPHYLHGCVAEDSCVVLADGSTKQIKDIHPGDLVVTSSGAIAPVKHLIPTGVKPVYAVQTWLSNEVVELSKDHKVLTVSGWKKVEELTDEDYIKAPGGRPSSKVKSVTLTSDKPTYDIEVDHPDHDFDTPIGIISNSEVASWEKTDQLETGILTAVGDAPGTEIILESTAKGIGNLFHSQCMAAIEKRSDYRLFFLPWFVHEANYKEPPEGFTLTSDEATLKATYNLTDGQIAFRRNKIGGWSNGEWKFRQEFPCTTHEAFQSSGESFFNGEFVGAARKSTITDPNQALIIGVDPARKGDRTVIAYRRGRHIEKIMTYTDMDEMQLAAILGKMINNDSPAAVFIDTAHGYGTIDRLVELKFGRVVTGVNFSERAIRHDVFANKRAEIYFELRDWLEDGGVRIPDTDDVELDLLCIPQSRETSNGRLLLAPKEEIKKDYGKSPDIADAFALTFAYPVKNPNIEYNSNSVYNGGKAKRTSSNNPGGLDSPVMNNFNRKANADRKKPKFR